MLYNEIWVKFQFSPCTEQEQGLGLRHGRMGCVVVCRIFNTAPEQAHGLTPIVVIVQVPILVPVPVPDTASVIT